MRKIEYNSQRDNFDFAGKFRAFNQCFSTCAIMFMSYYTTQVNGGDDEFLKKYLFDMEATLNPNGLGARLKLKYKWIKGATSVWWLVQQEGIQDYLNHYGVKGKCVFYDSNCYIESIPDFAKIGPIIIGTNKLGGLPGGHIILIVDYDLKRKAFIVHDPFGDATTNYKDTNGEARYYPAEWLCNYFASDKIGCARIIRWVS